MKKKITLIIPSDSNNFYINDFLINISLWSLIPNEIIVVNTSKKKYIIDFLTKKILKKKNIKLVIIHKKYLYPGAARNVGILASKTNYLVFLDMNTVPYSHNWLKSNFDFLLKKNFKGIIGQTFYLAETKTEKIIRASTYGKNLLNTLPGSIFDKSIFKKVGFFNSKIRAGEDIDWLRRLNKHGIKIRSSIIPVSYKGLSNVGYFDIIKKWFRNYSSSANLPHLSTQKNLYIFGLFIFLLFFVYNWNYYSNWNTNKIFIPHITKIFISVCGILYLIFRGLYLPIKKRISIKFLLPYNFVFITFFSFILDLVKTISFFVATFLKILRLDK